jgi:hypothetical protein
MVISQNLVLNLAMQMGQVYNESAVCTTALLI